MKKENAKIQANLMFNLVREMTKVSNRLNEMCENECYCKTTKEANEYFAEEYRETYEALFNALDVVAQRYYGINQIK